MIKISKTFCRRQKSGLTLIEAIAGTAILGTMLVSILLAEANSRRQSQKAQQRIKAIQAADKLLNDWWADIEQFPREASGGVPNHPNLCWQTKTKDNQNIEATYDIIVFEIYTSENQEEAPVVQIELLLPRHTEEYDEIL